MSSYSEERTNNIPSSENMLRDIQDERMIHQINSSSDVRKTSGKLKKNIEEITKAIENARSTAYEKKLEADELKINLTEKREKIKSSENL